MENNRQKNNMLKNQRFSNIYFLLALGLISLFVYTVLFSAISFIRGYPITHWQFPVAAVMMLITQYYAARELFEVKPGIIFLKCSSVLIALVILCMAFANTIYDVSFDGQWYHQETVYQLKTGWNPYYNELPVPKIPDVPKVKEIWCSGPHIPPIENPNADQEVVYIKHLSINHFAKGTEIAEAAIYALTNSIESGKAVNAMMLLASIFICLSLLYKMNLFSNRKNWMIAGLFAFNPVTLYQLTSFCVDGVMASLFVCLLGIFMLIWIDKNKFQIFLLGLMFMIAVNIKFTSLVYTLFFCSAFVLLAMIKRNWKLAKSIMLTGALSLTVGFVFIGFHPYMTNLIKHDNVFYSLTETQAEIYGITPFYLKEKNRFAKFLISYGARSFDKAADGESLSQVLKIPFNVNKRELLNASNPELEIAGFGPFFSGAGILSLILLAILTRQFYRQKDFRYGLYLLMVVTVSIFLIPDPWWARFAPQCWLFPVIVLFLCERFPLTRNKWIKPFVFISIALNIVWVLSGFLFNIVITVHINYQLAQMKLLSQPVFVEYCGYRDFRANRIRFYENKIPFIEKNVTGNYIYNVIHSNTRFESFEPLPDIPEPLLLQLNRKWDKTNWEQ